MSRVFFLYFFIFLILLISKPEVKLSFHCSVCSRFCNLWVQFVLICNLCVLSHFLLFQWKYMHSPFFLFLFFSLSFCHLSAWPLLVSSQLENKCQVVTFLQIDVTTFFYQKPEQLSWGLLAMSLHLKNSQIFFFFIFESLFFSLGLQLW